MKKPIMIIIAAIAAAAIGIAAYFWAAPDPAKQYYYSTGDAFVTNVLNSDRLIKTAVVLGISQDVGDDLNEKNAVLRDCILYVLRNQSEEQYQQGDLQQTLSNAIVERLNEIFPQEEGDAPLFVKAYFSDFVMQ
ncbi:MAG: flagellar basal body-associated FliL family protein [Clostridia bacterium]|nr:flagellar basal body-associated FliL family protein [Candidatus Pelethousia sp.]NCB31733.1 flagellar basal body-associated FliL family protein [Clostridia bacterium]